VEGVSGYFWEAILNPTIVRTNVSNKNNTVVEIRHSGIRRGDTRKFDKFGLTVLITDSAGRNERHDLEVNIPTS
jgi:hypothetical protein